MQFMHSSLITIINIMTPILYQSLQYCKILINNTQITAIRPHLGQPKLFYKTQILVRDGLFERPSLISPAHHIFFKIL